MRHIQILLEDDERELLHALADASGTSISQYCKNVVLSAGVKVDIPTASMIKSHTDEIMELKKMMKPLLQTIADSQYATDADVQNILRMINEISISEKSLLKNVIQMRSDIQKETAKNVKKAVRSQLKKKDTDAA